MKVVQTRMGHSNIAVTMDTYTHIFPTDADDSEKLAEAERASLGQQRLDHLLILAAGAFAPDDALGPGEARRLLDPLFKRRRQDGIPCSR